MIKELIFPSIILTVFAFFKIIFPTKPSQDVDLEKIEANRHRFARHESLAFLWVILSVALIGLPIWIISRELGELIFSGNFDYSVSTPEPYFVMLSLVVGIGLLKLPMDFIYTLLLRGDYKLYKQYTNIKHGFDGEKAVAPIFFTLTLVGIVGLGLGLNWFVRLDDNQIEINGLLNLKAHSYNINEIENIAHVDTIITEEGKKKTIDHYILKMTDGYEWKGKALGFFATKNTEKNLDAMMLEISKKTGLEIQNTPLKK
jgi:hypothetical protein